MRILLSPKAKRNGRDARTTTRDHLPSQIRCCHDRAGATNNQAAVQIAAGQLFGGQIVEQVCLGHRRRM
ncbi:MAG: hypothetical protein L7W43_06945, partial [Rubripirellula sp.]|nr:hypothetical protein [Rubripirellula sp.]